MSSSGSEEGSSTSFSGTCILARLDEPEWSGATNPGKSRTTAFLFEDDGEVSTDNGLDMPDGRAWLIEA